MNARQVMTSVSLQLPNSPVVLSMAIKTSIDLFQEPNAHDVAVIRLPFQRFDSLRTRVPYGQPITFTWTCPQGAQTFVGNVHTVKPWLDANSIGTEIIAVSAGFPMKKVSQRIWTNVRASDVAIDLATRHGLAYDVEVHPRVFPQIAQSGKSDWALLRELAERVGYSLRVEGVTLQFVSKMTLERYYRPMALPMTVSPTEHTIDPGLRDLMEFKPTLGEVQPEKETALARRRLATVDGSGHVVSMAQNTMVNPGRQVQTPLYDRFVNEVARSAEDAAHIVADASERARYPVTATARMWGDPHIAPNRSLLINGQENNVSGFWTVLSAKHHIVPGSGYTIDLCLGTEGLGDETLAPTVTGTSTPVSGLLKTPYPSVVLIQDQGATAKARWAPSFS